MSMRAVLSTLLATAATAATALGAGAAQAQGVTDPAAQFGFQSFETGRVGTTDAAGHPTVWTSFRFKNYLFETPGTSDRVPYGTLRHVEVQVPRGLVGNPLATPRCTRAQYKAQACPPQTQVGIAYPEIAGLQNQPNRPVYNMEPDGSSPVLLVIDYSPLLRNYSYLRAYVHPATGRVTAVTDPLPRSTAVRANRIELWGVPADENFCNPNREGFDPLATSPYDQLGFRPCPTTDPADWERKPFVTAPTDCSLLPFTEIDAFSWEGRHDSASWPQDHIPENCETLAFEPEIAATPTSDRAGAPTGLAVDVTVPQNDDPDGRGTPHVRQVRVSLPEGMTVNPSAADGLQSCTDAAFDQDSRAPSGCPDQARIGTVEVKSPVLENPLPGRLYVGAQTAEHLMRLFMEVEGQGVRMKLIGTVDRHPETGRVTTTFSENPQLPFETLKVRVKDGPRSPLTNPRDCGTHMTDARFVAWSGQVVERQSASVVDEGCAPLGFDPQLSAGTVTPIAGRFSPFALRIVRTGANQRELGRIDTTLPRGLVARLRGVERCTETQIAAGAGKTGRVAQSAPSCPAGSQIGTTTVGSGSGDLFYPRIPGTDVSGRVFLTDAYAGRIARPEGFGAPAYGLAIEVPAVAGPLDLGTVMVRAAIFVDPLTAQVRVVSDQLPRILQGVPIDARDVRVRIDRDRFTLNPTSCREQQVAVDIRAQDGTLAQRSSRFRVSGCAALPFKPRMSLALTGRRQTRTGKHPGVTAVVRQKGLGEAGIARAAVTLPRSLALDPANAQALCEFEDGTKADLERHCPKGAIVGRAVARTPLLDRPLSGKVYFVKNVERNPQTGALIRKLPMLVVALRGEIAINLVGKSSTSKDGRLINTFASVPDAPVERFELRIAGGENGILAVTRTRAGRIDLCAKPRSHAAKVRLTGQNGKAAHSGQRMKTPCAAERTKQERGR